MRPTFGLVKKQVGALLGLVLLACAAGDDGEEQATKGQASYALAPGTPVVYADLPQGLAVADVPLVASDRITLSDRVRVTRQGAGFGAIASSGIERLEVGADAKVGSVFTARDVFLRERARVEGDVTAGGTIERQNQVTVTGAQRANTSTTFRSIADFEVPFPTAGQDVHLEPDRQRTIAPGSYGVLHVKSRSKVRFDRSGEYFFTSFFLEPDATLEFSNAEGPIYVFVSGGTFIHRGKFTKDQATANVAFMYFGTSDAFIERQFVATLFAPHASVKLQVSPNSHRGAIYARRIEVQPDTQFQVEPFTAGACTGSVLACNIGFGCDDANSNEVPDCRECVESGAGGCAAAQPGAGGRYAEAQIVLPQTVKLKDFVVAARHEVELGNGATVHTEGDEVVAAAQGAVDLSSAASTPTIVAGDRATLAAGASVLGDVRTVTGSIIDTAAVVEGDVLSGQALLPPTVHRIPVSFAANNLGDRLVRTGESKIIWPGTYASLTIQAGATVYFKSGTYRFTEVAVAAGGSLLGLADAGAIRVYVADALDLDGTVEAGGDQPSEILLLYVGRRPVSLAGEFEGTLLAPSATLEVSGGEHRAALYGSYVKVAPGTVIGNPERPTITGIVGDDDTPPDVVIVRGQADGAISATAGAPVTFTPDGTTDFTIPTRIPVTEGSAGNGAVSVAITTGSGSTTCTYRGGSSVAHPVTPRDFAAGLEYRLVGCDGGQVGGTHVEAESVTVTVTGDPGRPPAVTVATEHSCDATLPEAIAPGDSYRMFEEFNWVNTELSVLERVGELPALYYGMVYVRSQEDLDMIDRLLIHRMKKPLFVTEWPHEWSDHCGMIDYASDGVGQWIFVVIPGATYNKIIEARANDDVSQELKDAMPPVVLRDIPPAAQAFPGASATFGMSKALNMGVLKESGFKYQYVPWAPDTTAILDAVSTIFGNQGVFQSGLIQFLGDLIEWIVEAVVDVVREVIVFFGTIDSLFAGTTSIRIDLNVLNTGEKFEPVMRRAWGPAAGAELSPTGTRVTMHMVSQSLWSLGAPIPTDFRGYTDSRGVVNLDVAKRTSLRAAAFNGLCFEYSNDAAKMAGFLLAAEVCDPGLSDNDFGDFREDSVAVEYDLSNRRLSLYNEMTDGHEYMGLVVGSAPRQAFVAVGHAASVLGGPKKRAWTPGLGWGNVVVDNIFAGALGFGAPIDPFLFSLAASYTAILAQTDIVIPDRADPRQRGLATHEYGHFAWQHMARETGFTPVDDWHVTLDFMNEGDDLAANDHTRITIEGLADFFAAQVGSGVNYFTPTTGTSPEKQNIVHCIGASALSPGRACVDENWFQTGNGRDAIGRLATLLQDVYDGHAKFTLAPSSADGWESVIVDPLTSDYYLKASNRTDGHSDRENVVLGGPDIMTLIGHMNDGDDYPVDVESLERAIGKTLEDRNVSWCDRCFLAVPHFMDETLIDVRTLMEECASDPDVSRIVGSPPLKALERDAFTCSVCPLGQGMRSDGHCEPCSVDRVVDWGDGEGGRCDAVTVAGAEQPGIAVDTCPSMLVVDVIDNDPEGVVGWIEVDRAPTNAGPFGTSDCTSVTLAGSFGPVPGAASPFSLIGAPRGGLNPDPCVYDLTFDPGAADSHSRIMVESFHAASSSYTSDATVTVTDEDACIIIR